jgi:hypothetical protein
MPHSVLARGDGLVAFSDNHAPVVNWTLLYGDGTSASMNLYQEVRWEHVPPPAMMILLMSAHEVWQKI